MSVFEKWSCKIEKIRAFTSAHVKKSVYVSLIKLTFSILHSYFSKCHTSNYLFYIILH